MSDLEAIARLHQLLSRTWRLVSYSATTLGERSEIRMVIEKEKE